MFCQSLNVIKPSNLCNNFFSFTRHWELRVSLRSIELAYLITANWTVTGQLAVLTSLNQSFSSNHSFCLLCRSTINTNIWWRHYTVMTRRFCKGSNVSHEGSKQLSLYHWQTRWNTCWITFNHLLTFLREAKSVNKCVEFHVKRRIFQCCKTLQHLQRQEYIQTVCKKRNRSSLGRCWEEMINLQPMGCDVSHARTAV